MTEETLFAAALERENPHERQAFLDEACGGDAVLRRRVEALLKSHARGGAFLVTPVLEQMAACRPAGSTASPEASAGPSPAGPDPVLGLLETSRRPAALGRLKHYEVLEVLGKGAFGTVLKMFDERLHRVVAVKVLAPCLAGSDNAAQRFLREARAAAAVRHDHVISIHAVEDEPMPYLVMEYIEGQNLQQKLDRTGPLPIDEVLRIGYQMAVGLAAAHKQGLIHRDIKPSNILLENGVERVKLSDFGLARAVDDASLTDSGVVAGTPLYMSPEQAAANPWISAATCSAWAACCTRSARARRPSVPASPWPSSGPSATIRRPLLRTQQPRPRVPGGGHRQAPRQEAGRPHPIGGGGCHPAGKPALGIAAPRQGVASGATKPALCPDCNLPRGSRKRKFLFTGLAAIFVLALLVGGAYLSIVRPWERPGGALRPSRAIGASSGAGFRAGQAVARPARTGEAAGLRRQPEARQDPCLPAGERRRRRPEEGAGRTGSDPGQHGLCSHMQGSHEGGVQPGREVSGLGCRDLQPPGPNLHELGGETLGARTGKPIRDFKGHTGAVHGLAFSPDGKRLATASYDETARVWEVETGKEVLTFKDEGKVRTVAFSGNGKWIATGHPGDHKVILWDAATGARKLAFEKHTSTVVHVTFSPDSSLVASTATQGDGSVRIWEPETGKEIVRLVCNTEGPRETAFSHDGKRLVSVGEHGTGQVWDVASGQVLFDLPGHTNVTLGAACSPDGKHIATASLDGTVKTWDAGNGKLLHTRPGQIVGSACVAFSPDGKQLASGGYNGQIVIHDVSTGKVLFSGHNGQVFAVAISPDGRTLASAGIDRTVRLWDLSSGEMLHTLIGHQHAAAAVSFSPDGKRLASGGGDGTVRMWDVVAGKELLTLVGHGGGVRGVAFSPDGQVLASAGEDGAVLLWNGASGKPLVAFRSGDQGWCVAFNRDSQTLASGHPGVVRIWDRTTNSGVSLPQAHKDHVRAVAFHPDGRSLASAGAWGDKTVRLWDLTASREQRRLEGHTGDVLSCVWRADGGLLASCGGSDGTIRLWDAGDLSRCQVMRLFPADTKWLYGAAFTPEGRYLATANPDGTIYVLKLAERGVVFRPTPEKGDKAAR